MDVCRPNRWQNSLSKRRLAYTLAAGAASTAVGLSDAEAAISYSGIQDISINQFNSLNLLVDDQDDNGDIVLKNYVFGGGNYQGATVGFTPGRIAGFQSGSLFYVSALEADDPINASTMGPKFYGAMAYGENDPNDQFDNATNAYVGLGFPINGSTENYYGWIRVSINNAEGTFVVHDWAYQTEIGVGILAGDVGETSTPPMPGDFNGDTKVDVNDYVVWRASDGTALDYDEWASHYGNGVTGSASSAVVPEPITLGLLAAGSLGLAILRRTRREKS